MNDNEIALKAQLKVVKNFFRQRVWDESLAERERQESGNYYVQIQKTLDSLGTISEPVKGEIKPMSEHRETEVRRHVAAIGTELSGIHARLEDIYMRMSLVNSHLDSLEDDKMIAELRANAEKDFGAKTNEP